MTWSKGIHMQMLHNYSATVAGVGRWGQQVAAASPGRRGLFLLFKSLKIRVLRAFKEHKCGSNWLAPHEQFSTNAPRPHSSRIVLQTKRHRT